MARGGKLQAWVERSEDVFAGTCHASFPKAQLHSSEEAAVDASRALPSLVLPPSAVLPSVQPSGACQLTDFWGKTPGFVHICAFLAKEGLQPYCCKLLVVVTERCA